MMHVSDSFEDEATDPVLQLPFVAPQPDGTCHYWAVTPNGHYETDLKLGEFFGVFLLGMARHWQRPELIGFVLADMVRGGRLGALEIGFLSVVCSAANVGVLN
jgi:hypothetical protein